MTPLTSDKFKRGVIFEITVIDTIKPTGQRSLPDFRALIIGLQRIKGRKSTTEYF